MKILVVDDELVSREKMQAIMGSFGECEAVEKGVEAVETFRRTLEGSEPFDLITLDIIMPDLDGMEALIIIRQIEDEKKIPNTERVKIFMVTSHSKKDTILSCVQAGCDDFITKPFNREIITQKLINNGVKIEGSTSPEQLDTKQDRTIEKNGQFIDKMIEKFNRGEIDLPSLPQIHLKFKELADKGATLQNIAELLRKDAAISSKLISISNSAYYRGVSENKTLESAIARLGIKTTKQTVNAIANRSMYTTGNEKYTKLVEDLWQHSLSCAYASQIVAQKAQVRLTEDAFTLGLLHDIGKLILIQVVGEAEKRTQASDEVQVKEMFSALDPYHGKTGGLLLKKWGFSEKYISVSLYHDALEKADNITRELEVVHFANLLVKSMGFGQSEPLDIALHNVESAGLLNLDSAKIDEIKPEIQEQIDSVKQLLE